MLSTTKYSIVFISLFLLLTACSNGGMTQGSTVGSTPNVMIEILDGTYPEAREIRIETIPQNNCGGTAEVENQVQRSRSIARTIEVGGGFEVNANGGIGFADTDVELGAAVATQLGYSYGTVEDISRSITVKAKPGTRMEHHVSLQEIWEGGTAKIVVNGQEITVPFSFRSDFAIELLDSKDIGCEPELSATSPVAELTDTPPKTEPTASPAPTRSLLPDTPSPELPTPTNTPAPEPTTTDTPPPPSCPSGLICYEADFSKLDPRLWCKIPPNKLDGGQLLITAIGSIEDTRYELQPREGLGRSLRFIELTMKIATADGPPGNAHAGIQADPGNDGYFFFSLDSGGNGYMDPGVPKQDISFPLGGFDITHTLRVEWTGHEVLFFIDGSQPKTRLATEGFGNWFLLHVTAYKGASITAQFDNVRWGVVPP